MITGVCLNPCIDKTVTIESFIYGGMNRITSIRYDISGKAVNVAVVARRLGCEAACTGFNYSGNGRIMNEYIKSESLHADFLELPGEIRTNLKVLDKSKSVITEINESGVQASGEQQEAMIEKVKTYARKSDYMVFSGSLPPGCDPSLYRILIEAAHSVAPDCRCILDAEGEKLTKGVLARPFFIKPNQYELELAVAKKLTSIEEIFDAAKTFIARGVKLVAVSMGADGALLTDGVLDLYAPRMAVDVKSTVGAGDSMVAGFLKGLESDGDAETLLRYGVAAATACVMTEGSGLPEKREIEALISKVEIRRFT